MCGRRHENFDDDDDEDDDDGVKRWILVLGTPPLQCRAM